MIRLFISLYLILLAGVFAYKAIGQYAITPMVHDWIELDRTNDYIGGFYMLDALHQRLPPDEFDAVLANYPDRSNLPLTMMTSTDTAIPAPIRERLVAGESNVLDLEADIIYHRLSGPEPGRVVALGPVGTYEPLMEASRWYELSMFVVLAMPVFFWLARLQAKLRGLERVATRLGEGDLSARASEKGGDRVGRLNQAFNRMAERLENLIASHRSLTNAVAHELRTPVTRARFQLDMMRQETDEAERQGYMYGVSDDIDELADLVDELLTYARFDRAPLSPALTPHNLHQSLDKVVAAYRHSSDIRVEYSGVWHAGDEDRAMVPFEPRHLERAIGNLVGNAHKYAHSRIRILVRQDGDRCEVLVEDDGPGIPVEERQRVFDPFRRLDSSRTRSTGGYGLGLAIVRQVALWHRGRVTVTDSDLGGACFCVSWPTVW